MVLLDIDVYLTSGHILILWYLYYSKFCIDSGSYIKKKKKRGVIPPNNRILIEKLSTERISRYMYFFHWKFHLQLITDSCVTTLNNGHLNHTFDMAYKLIVKMSPCEMAVILPRALSPNFYLISKQILKVFQTVRLKLSF